MPAEHTVRGGRSGVLADYLEKLKKIAEMLDVGEEKTLPSRSEVIAFIDDVRMLMFPVYYSKAAVGERAPLKILEDAYLTLARQIEAAFAFSGEDAKARAEQLSLEIVGEIPEIKRKLLTDIEAIYEGDPAARSPEEIILCYPGFFAISIYRIAHEFYKRGVPYLPRIMTEYAHEKTGIDIHAGAAVGEYFFIDHGTGIVVGETTVIGNHVKLYQGVTLGAKSFELDADGNPVKGIKRHPNIEDNVIIYANATILGGRTTIGRGAVIGGNVWITRSVAEGAVVSYNEK